VVAAESDLHGGGVYVGHAKPAQGTSVAGK